MYAVIYVIFILNKWNIEKLLNYADHTFHT